MKIQTFQSLEKGENGLAYQELPEQKTHMHSEG